MEEGLVVFLVAAGIAGGISTLIAATIFFSVRGARRGG